MKIKVYANRQLSNESNYYGTMYENLATSLEFEFPEYVEVNDKKYKVDDLIKYIVFEDDKQDLIINNQYLVPYGITIKEEVKISIKLMEQSTEDMQNKLIWHSEILPIRFKKSFEGKTEITPEELDIFNRLVTQVFDLTKEVKKLIDYQEQFKKDVKAGKFDGKPGYTPQKGVDYFTVNDINEIVANVLKTDTISNLNRDVTELNRINNEYTFLIKEENNAN